MNTGSDTPEINNLVHEAYSALGQQSQPIENLAAAIDSLPQIISGHYKLGGVALNLHVSYPRRQDGPLKTPEKSTSTQIIGPFGGRYWLNRNPDLPPTITRLRVRFRDLAFQILGAKWKEPELVPTSKTKVKLLAFIAMSAIKQPDKKIRFKE